MKTIIEQTEEFLKAKFEQSAYFAEHKEDKEYRLEHSYRVANIGKQIAKAEGLDEEGLIIACLLHDVGYCEIFDEEEDWQGHGRKSAKIARPFLEKLGLEQSRIDEICYGIAIHVDGEAGFEGERTPFALSVNAADKIDRFDAYRIYESLQYIKFSSKSLVEKKEIIKLKIENLEKNKELELGTKTAKEMWISRLVFQLEFFRKLEKQLESSVEIIPHTHN